MELPTVTSNTTSKHETPSNLGEVFTRYVKCRTKRNLKNVFFYWKLIMLVMVILMLLPLALSTDQRARCGFVVLLMTVSWVFQLVPLAVTAFFPVVLFPMLGILSCNEVAKEYYNDTIFLFIGGLIVAAAVEKNGLHERIALRVAICLGARPEWIMAGLMLLTAGFSMFISNTATSAMLVPIARSLADQLVSSKKGRGESNCFQSGNPNDVCEPQPDVDSKQDKSLRKALVICICFASNIGGTATLTGTPPNLVLVGQMERLYKGKDTGLNYLSWLLFAFPLMIVGLVICWTILRIYFLRKVSASSDDATNELKRRYQALNKIRFAEGAVAICFVILVIMWIARKPGHLKGIGGLFPAGYYSDATSAMLISIIMFIVPSKIPPTRKESYPTLMDWDGMKASFQWNLVVLLGGGFALATGIRVSELSDLIGHTLAQFANMPLFFVQSALVVLAMVVTNICSNTATANIFLPIVADVAVGMGIHPFQLMIPVTIACSFAFMLPVGTPSNTIAFNSKILKIPDMFITGIAISLSLCLIVGGYTTFVGNLVFGLNEFPEWAMSSNQTNIL